MSLFRTAKDQDYDVLRAEIAFIHDLQLEIEAALDRRGMTQADLASLLNVSEARVSQILSDNGTNLEARTVARIAHKLGRLVKVRFEDIAAPAKRQPICMSEWARTRAQDRDWPGLWGRAVASNENSWEEAREFSRPPPVAMAGAQ